MKPRLSDKQKITFLRKRYNDAFDLLENASAWLKKNSELNQQKLQFLKSIRQQRLSGFSTAKNAEKEKKLSVATREYNRMGERFMELISFVENDEKAIKRLGGRLQKRVLGGVSVAKSNSSSFGRPRESHESQVEMAKSNSSSFGRPRESHESQVEIWKAKAQLYDGESRQGTSELKIALKPELTKFGKCAYCEERLFFEDCHLDHIHPINKGGFTIESNCILVCASCNGRKGALSLRAFCKEADLDFEKVVTRLEVLGKHV